MSEYFSAIDLFLDRCLIDATQGSSPQLAALGMEGILTTIDAREGSQSSYNLDPEIAYSAIALAPDRSHCILGRCLVI
jgi:hypothetical protein